MTILRGSDLDEAAKSVADALRARGFPRIDALYSLATGVGFLPAGLESGGRIELAKLPGVPASWKGASLHIGRVRSADLLIIEDPASEPRGDVEGETPAAWERAFPCWLAAALGAAFCVHVGAGVALPPDSSDPSDPKEAPEPLAGRLVLLTDHINVSGRTPLVGLGESQLGPLFPDLSELHHAGLRRAALAHAERLGLPVSQAVGACTLGPALLTPAERRFLRIAGAQVAEQGLADPLLASAHAGLSVLAVVAVTEDGEDTLDVRAVVAETQRLAPAIDELLQALAEDVARMAGELRDCD